MARVTVEDCIEKVDSPYQLVLVAKERVTQLNSGEETTLPRDNDKNTVISLREIGEGKVSIKTLEDSAVNKLRKLQDKNQELEDLEEEYYEDEFDKIYKGEVSKSGTAILPSKRTRRMTEKVNTSPKKTIDESSPKKEEEPKLEAKEESISAEKKAE